MDVIMNININKLKIVNNVLRIVKKDILVMIINIVYHHVHSIKRIVINVWVIVMMIININTNNLKIRIYVYKIVIDILYQIVNNIILIHILLICNV